MEPESFPSVPAAPDASLVELGEFGLISRLVDRFDSPPPPAGPGDDAAVVPAPDGRLVVSTDLLAEGIHFRRDWSSGYDIGRRAAAANLADIAAMGATPTAMLIGLAAPPETTLSWLEQLADGFRDECARVGARVVGGDTIGSTDRVTLAITALGDLGGRAPVTRAGARPGDVVVVAGRLGWAAAGLDLFRAGIAERFPTLASALHRPEPPYAAGPALRDLGASAMCDVSDGLVADAGHLADASGVRLDLDPGAVREPELDAAGEALGERRSWELSGGDDHALLATVAAAVLSPAVSVGALAGLRRIGVVRNGRGVTLRGRAPARTAAGHEHFRS